MFAPPSIMPSIFVRQIQLTMTHSKQSEWTLLLLPETPTLVNPSEILPVTNTEKWYSSMRMTHKFNQTILRLPTTHKTAPQTKSTSTSLIAEKEEQTH